MALSRIGLVANNTSLTGATLTNANAAGTFTVDQGSSNTNIFSDSVNFTANTTHAGTATFTGNVSLTGATVAMKENWNIVNSNNVTLAVGKNYAVNSAVGVLQVNLPSSASIGDVISVQDGQGVASSNTIVISRNGNNIDGLAKNIIINENASGAKLVYISSSIGWVSEKRERAFQLGFQGLEFGFAQTGEGTGSSLTTTIDRYSFLSDGNASDVGDVTVARRPFSGQSSSISGYTSGGNIPPGGYSDVIDKFPFASLGTGTDVGDLVEGVQNPSTGQSSAEDGYVSGGLPSPSGAPQANRIQKFAFASDGNASDLGNLTQGRYQCAGVSSTEFGYVAGGFIPPGVVLTNIIDKFPFAVGADATDVGDLAISKRLNTGSNSKENGYSMGGYSPSGSTVIEKWPFASDANASNVGALSQARGSGAGASSTTHGFMAGGDGPYLATIDKYPFATDETAANIGDLVIGRRETAGAQV